MSDNDRIEEVRKFTSPFDNELCPKCRAMHKPQAVISEGCVSCVDCGMYFTPLKKRKEQKEILGKVKWKRT